MSQSTKGLLYDPARVTNAMAEIGVDALVATTPANVQYLSRYRKPGDTLAVVCRSDPTRPVLIVPTASLDFWLEDPLSTVEVLAYGTFYRELRNGVDLPDGERLIARLHEDSRTEADRWDLLAEVLSDASLSAGVIGVDGAHEALDSARHRLPTAEFRQAGEAFRRLRSVKSSDEIRRLAEVARITENAIAESSMAIGHGAMQRDIARAFRRFVSDADAGIRSDSISIDGGAALGNVNVPADVVRDGSVIRYDVGAIAAGYASDISRCFVFGAPDPKVEQYYAALLAGQDRALATLRPGVPAADVFEKAVTAVRAAGIPHYRRTHVGHGIGIAGAGYDAPLLAPGNDTPLEAGMVLCVETPYYELGFTGLQVEDMVLVTDDGYTPLTYGNRDLRRLP